MLLNNNLHIAVLLTCYNRKDKTLQCLQSFYKSINKLPELNFEIFLVDDGSSDGTTEAVQGFFPEICIIQGTGELYWNRGMHLAWETASKKKDFDYYLWLNDDVELYDHAISDLFEIAFKYDGIAVGVMQESPKGQTTYGGLNENGELINPNGTIQPCRVFNGNLVLVPNVIFEKVGMLDSFYWHSMGDLDYAFRSLKKGFKHYIPGKYSGICKKNTSLPKWCLSGYSIKEKLKSLYSPLGNSHPYYYFIYEYRHYGLGVAIKHFITIHLRVLMPKLWNQK